MLKSILANSPDFQNRGKFWTHALSLVEGCTPVSPGCANCWLAGMERRLGAKVERGVDGSISEGIGSGYVKRTASPLVNGSGAFNGTVRFRSDRLDKPLRAKKPRVYAIWSDLFHEGVAVDGLNRAFDVMNRAKHHHFVIITKRPNRAAWYMASWPQWSPMANVTFLVSMEDQERARARAPYAAALALAGWRVGVLCEPLLSPITFRWITGDSLAVNGVSNQHDFLRLMSWVITGGESGSKARPAHPEWVRSLRDQATAAGVPFMFKQWGEWLPLYDGISPSRCTVKASDVGSLSASGQYRRENCVLGDDEVFVAKAGKSKAGRLLDGREWLEVPSL